MVYFYGEQERSFATKNIEDRGDMEDSVISVVPLFEEGDVTFWRREWLVLPKVRRQERALERINHPPCATSRRKFGQQWKPLASSIDLARKGGASSSRSK